MGAFTPGYIFAPPETITNVKLNALFGEAEVSNLLASCFVTSIVDGAAGTGGFRSIETAAPGNHLHTTSAETKIPTDGIENVAVTPAKLGSYAVTIPKGGIGQALFGAGDLLVGESSIILTTLNCGTSDGYVVQADSSVVGGLRLVQQFDIPIYYRTWQNFTPAPLSVDWSTVLHFTAAASTLYIVRVWFPRATASKASGDDVSTSLLLQLTGPASPSFVSLAEMKSAAGAPSNSSDGPVVSGVINSFGNSKTVVTVSGVGNTSAEAFTAYYAAIKPGSTAGDVAVQIRMDYSGGVANTTPSVTAVCVAEVLEVANI